MFITAAKHTQIYVLFIYKNIKGILNLLRLQLYELISLYTQMNVWPRTIVMFVETHGNAWLFKDLVSLVLGGAHEVLYLACFLMLRQ